MIRLMDFVRADYDETNGTITLDTSIDMEDVYPTVTLSVKQFLAIADSLKNELSKKEIEQIGKVMNKK
jgi:hypothetical protein